MKKIISILLIEDEESLREIISFNLVKAGFTVYTAKNGNEGIEFAKLYIPDIILLDIMMPYKSGFEVHKILKESNLFKNTLFVYLTALNNESKQLMGLNLGADDYITKPISMQLLISRINALTRRIQHNDEKIEIIECKYFILNKLNFNVKLMDNTIIHFPKKEFELLFLLASQPNKVFLRDEIFKKIWGEEVVIGDRTIDVHIRKIRKKLNMDIIKTIKGVGYKFLID